MCYSHKANISRKLRSLIAQIRFGILPIKIETGRARGIPLERRICEFCDSGEIEDEIHFLFTCSKHSLARTCLMNILSENPIFNDLSLSDKMKYMFNEKYNVTARFISDAMLNRLSVLYR